MGPGNHHGRIQWPVAVRKRLFMLIAPAMWYEFVPGVTDTGFSISTSSAILG
jgi:hypothetical protein